MAARVCQDQDEDEKKKRKDNGKSGVRRGQKMMSSSRIQTSIIVGSYRPPKRRRVSIPSRRRHKAQGYAFI